MRALVLASLFALVSALVAALTAQSSAPRGTIAQAYTGGLKPYGRPSESDLASAVDLAGSRGEVLNFAVRVKTTGCFDIAYSFMPSAPLDLRFREMRAYKSAKPSYRGAKIGSHLDALVPRARPCPVDDGEYAGEAWVMGELVIPREIAPGQYAGRLQFGAAELPLKLKVWPMIIPERPAIPMYAELTSWYLVLGHYGKWHESEAELARKYAESMREHRMAPVKNWIRYIELENDKADLKVGGAHSFMESVVAQAPAGTLFSVPFSPEQHSQEALGKRYFASLQDALKREGLLDRAFVYAWDEPGPKDQAKLLEFLKVIRGSAPGLKTMVTTPYSAKLAPFVDIFAPVVDQLELSGFPGPAAYRKSQLEGHSFWFYVSCMSHGCGNDEDSGTPDWVIDRPSAYIRSMGWMGAKYGADGLLYYSVNNGYQHFAQGRDPWADLYDFSGNGDGTLFYPGRQGLFGLKEHGPIETVRLKQWRESSFDAEYIKWMNGVRPVPDWWPKQLESVVRNTRDWSRDNADYRRVRLQIGEFLAQQESRKEK